MKWLDGIIDSIDMSLSRFQETEDREAWQAELELTEQQQQWLDNNG